ncbi:microtubule-actin cross-linking factor 1, isoforms 6/7-like [Centropristis striata]|uniref:microtubule-actin cross-linking factor 1, isoforms 6/7-like n=1 Tax=Centropristis striata TaxID=184440 RepID=UPI0027DFB1BE|nr:microtubule-actin cross-linking factor 1, isoforms 6/7-like [Centropristis striata]
MSFASDKLYNGYLRRKMPTIATKVKVREILVHLPCLTSQDRENIEAKREICGNFDSIVLLLDCLKRRENWPEQFIEALEALEQTTLASEIRDEYNKLKGTDDSNPSSPSMTVVRAHVHPAPSASHLSTPESAANNPAAVVLPAEAPPAEESAPPEPAAQASPAHETSVQPQAPQSSADKVPEAVSPPEPAPEPPQPTQNEVAPPPSAPHTQATETPKPQKEINSHPEPEEHSDIQDYSGDGGVIPQDSGPVEQCETDAASRPDPLQKTTTDTTKFSPPQSPSLSKINSDVTDGSSFLTNDTTPPVDIKPAAVLQPEETSEPPASKVGESSLQSETAAITSTLPDAAEMDASLCADSTVCLSKPGPNLPEPSSTLQPCSGNNERLEISEAAPDNVTSAHLPACSAVTSTTVTAASALPCQENGIALNHNEPEENHYESPSQVLEVLENVVHVSEEPSILNLDGQSSTPHIQIVNGGAAKEIPSGPPLSNNATDTVSSVDALSSDNHQPSEPAAADISPETLQDSQEKKGSRNLPTNTKYILTAAGVGACALLMAWRFKN